MTDKTTELYSLRDSVKKQKNHITLFTMPKAFKGHTNIIQRIFLVCSSLDVRLFYYVISEMSCDLFFLLILLINVPMRPNKRGSSQD